MPATDGGDPKRRRTELAEAVRSDRIHGAYLFEGPAGTGRRATALWFARLVVCRSPGESGTDDGGPCGRCADCRRSAPSEAGELGSHPDLIRVEPDGAQIRIDQVRTLQRDLSLVPNEGGRRAAILFDAERLNAGSANALLKTLEEPPPRTTLILVAEHADSLPPTIRSRTTRIRFPPLGEEAVAAALSGAGLDERDARLAAALGGGSVESASAWAEAHLDDARSFADALDSSQDRSVSDLLDLAEGFRGAGEAVRERVSLFLAVHAAAARRRVEAATRSGDRDATVRWLDRAEAGERARNELLRRNLNPQLVVEGLLLDWQATP